MAERRVDVAIVGAGTAGLAYRRVREHAERLLLVEGGRHGAVCAGVGCMPGKLQTGIRAVRLARAVLAAAAALVVAVAAPLRAGVALTEGRFDDPFAYCAAVGTIDVPDARYTGPAMPEAVVRGLKAALALPADAPLEPLLRNTIWRCMEGQVYTCTIGANLPCAEKADTGREPSRR